MSDATSCEEALVTAVLHGGPVDLPSSLRRCEVAADQRKIKISWLGGHEHFERDFEVAPEPGQPVVFRWADRTKVAE